MNCKDFARRVAAGVEPLSEGLRGRVRFRFWFHWSICPFCRRYWRELREIGALQRASAALQNHPTVRISDIKQRLKQKLIKKNA